MPLNNFSVVEYFGEDQVLACGCIKLTFFNKYNLTDRDKNRPIIYKDKPIGYIYEVTKYTILAMVDNKYLRLMPGWDIDFDHLMGFDLTLGEEND